MFDWAMIDAGLYIFLVWFLVNYPIPGNPISISGHRFVTKKNLTDVHSQDYPRDLSANNTCLAIRGRGEIGALKTWEDANCYDNNHFICEYLW